MQTIVVVFAQRLKVGILVEEMAGSPTVDSLQQYGEPSVRQAKLGAKSAGHEKSMPPFWTWFIENPRGCGAI